MTWSFLERFLNWGFSFSILHWLLNKDYFIGKFTRLYKGNPETSAPSFNNFENILSEEGALDVYRQDKIFLIVSSVAMHSSELW